MLQNKLDLISHQNFIHFLNAFGDMSKGRYKITSFDFLMEDNRTYVVFDMHCLERGFTTSRTDDKEFYCVETWKMEISDNKTPEFEGSQVIEKKYISKDGDDLYMYT